MKDGRRGRGRGGDPVPANGECRLLSFSGRANLHLLLKALWLLIDREIR